VGSSLEGVTGGAGGRRCPSSGGEKVGQDNTRLWKLQRVLELRFRKLGDSGRKGEQARQRPSMARSGARCARSRGNRRLLYPCVRRWGLSCVSRRGSHGMGTKRVASTANGGLRAARLANGRWRRSRPAHAGAACGIGQRACQHHAQETRGVAWTARHGRASACGPSRAAARARALECQGVIPNSA
jgi:hypothetical protein